MSCPLGGKAEFVVRDLSLLSGFNNPPRSCSTDRPARVTPVTGRLCVEGVKGPKGLQDTDHSRGALRVSMKYFGASNGFPLLTNTITRMAIHAP